jgi:hypothetical protein
MEPYDNTITAARCRVFIAACSVGPTGAAENLQCSRFDTNAGMEAAYKSGGPSSACNDLGSHVTGGSPGVIWNPPHGCVLSAAVYEWC